MDNDERFRIWMREVDRCLEARYGLLSDDLADCPYREWFDQGTSASAAARKAKRWQ